MFTSLKFKIVNKKALRLDIYIKNQADLIEVNDKLHRKYIGKNIRLIEYFDYKFVAKKYFNAVGDEKVTEEQLDWMEDHYIAEMNMVTGELRRHKDSELIKKYYL